MLMHLDFPATVLAPSIARGMVERFIQACPRSTSHYDQAIAIWVTSELVSAAVEYRSGPSTQFGLRLHHDDESYTATLTGKDGVGLVARELADDTLRGRSVEILTQIVDRWGCRADQDGDHVWITVDLGGEHPRTPGDSEQGRGS